jgi:hypothetical protein
LGQSNVQVLSGVKGYGVDQRPVVDQRYLSVAQGVQQVGNVEEKEVGVVPVVQSGVQQVGVGVDQRQVQVLSGVQDIGKSQVVNQRHVVIRPEVVQQVGGLTDQRDVHLVQSGVHDVGGVDHRVVQHLVKPGSVVSVQQQRVNPLVGVQYVIPTERRNAVPHEGFVVQQSPQIQVPNQAVVVSPWISQYGYQLRQPAIQQHQVVSQQVPVSNLQEYYQSVSLKNLFEKKFFVSRIR